MALTLSIPPDMKNNKIAFPAISLIIFLGILQFIATNTVTGTIKFIILA